MPNLIVKRMESQSEEDSLRDLATQAFNFPQERWESFPPMVGRENIRVASLSDDVVGGMSFYPVGQWFGGRSVRMAGFALVVVAPEQRGQGVAANMLRNVMYELRQSDYPIATLYATTQRVYRKVGFEQAGNCYTYSVPTSSLVGLRQKMPARRVRHEEHQETLQRLFSQAGRENNGWIERNAGMWLRACRELRGQLFTYLIGDPGQERGFLIYDQERVAASASPMGQCRLVIRDMVALDEEAQETAWALAGSNRSVIDSVAWCGPASDSRCLMMQEHEASVAFPRRWMLRLLNVRTALLDRGYPRIDGQLAFEITDALIPENQGVFTLVIENGQPTIVDGATTPPIRIDVQYLAPLYSGLWSTTRLRAHERLACSDDDVIQFADQLFSGSEPWMPDSF